MATVQQTDAFVLAKQASEASGAKAVELKLEALTRFDVPIESREKFAQQLVDAFQDEHDLVVLGKAYVGLGTALFQRGKGEEANQKLLKAEEIGLRCVDRDPQVFFKARCNRAACLTAMEASDVVPLLQEAIDFAKPYDDLLDVPFLYYLLALNAEKAGAFDMAFQYLRTSFDISNRSEKVALAAQAGVTILGLLGVLEDHKAAHEWIDKVKPWVEKTTDPMVKMAFRLHCEDNRSAMGDPALASENLRKLALEAEESKNKQLEGNVYLSLIAVENNLERYDQAIEIADKAIPVLGQFKRSLMLAKSHRATALLGKGKLEEALKGCEEILKVDTEGYPRWKALELKCKVLRQLGRPEAALEALEEARKDQENRLEVRAREQANFLSAIFDEKNRLNEVALATEKQQAAEAKTRLAESVATHAYSDRNAAIGISILILLMLGVVSLYIKMSIHRRHALAMAERERQLNRELNERLEEQANQLRSEIAVRRQLELAVERKHRDEAIGKLTGGVAHDFNNLLTVIIQSIELSKLTSPTLPVQVVNLLDSSLKAAESGASIVSQLLAYARQQPLSPKPILLSEWLTASRPLFRQTLGSGILFQELDQSEGAVLFTDSARLTTAIINLLANARDAVSTTSGAIELRVRKCMIDGLQSKEWNDIPVGEYVQFEVRDNGKGMTALELERACEPFYSTKNPAAGTGLGLSSVLGFVKQSGGDLKLASVYGEGTTASFLLPVFSKSTSLIAESSARGESENRNRILLVEDQEQVRFVIGLCLKSMGLEVVEACSADQAIEILQEKGAPKWVLSDIRMPGSMNGIQLRRWILNRFSGVQVVLMSGYRDCETELDPEAVFLQKPIKPLELQKALEV